MSPDPFIPVEENQPVEGQVVSAATTEIVPNPGDTLGDFIENGEAAPEFELPDPASVITVRTSGGETRYVPTSEPLTVAEVLLRSDLRPTGAVQYWLNGAQVQSNSVVPAGSTMTLIGSVKGGRA